MGLPVGYMTAKKKREFLAEFAETLRLWDTIDKVDPTGEKTCEILLWYHAPKNQDWIRKQLNVLAAPFEVIPKGLIIRKILVIESDPKATPRDRLAAMRMLLEYTETPGKDPGDAAEKFLDATYGWVQDAKLIEE